MHFFFKYNVYCQHVIVCLSVVLKNYMQLSYKWMSQDWLPIVNGEIQYAP